MMTFKLGYFGDVSYDISEVLSDEYYSAYSANLNSLA